MKEDAIQIFRLVLLRQLRALSDLRRPEGIPRVEGESGDTVDLANTEIEKNLVFHLQEREVDALREICHALKRIEEETFGLCGDCQQEIPLRRLMANPRATLCMDCQSRKEQTGSRRSLNGKRPRSFLEA